MTGDWFYPGDQDTLDYGSLQIARVVTDVEQFDWGYHVLFDVAARWCAARRDKGWRWARGSIVCARVDYRNPFAAFGVA